MPDGEQFTTKVSLSRERALWIAQKNAESGVFFGIIIIILFFLLGVWLASNGEYLYAIMCFAMIVFALWAMRRAHRFAKIYEQERVKAAAEYIKSVQVLKDPSKKRIWSKTKCAISMFWYISANVF